jgi:hypothetical protein
MKYSYSIDINVPRDRVVELFDDPANMSKWQPGLVSFEHISGMPGQPGAKSRLIYEEGKRRIELLETITARDLPDEFTATYETKGVFNLHQNRFEDLGEKTRWTMETEFEFFGFMKVIGLVMGGMFRKQTAKILEDFKAFAESEAATPSAASAAS